MNQQHLMEDKEREHYNNFLTLDPCSDLGLGMEVEVCTTGTEFSNDADSESLGGRTETMVDFIKAEPVEETLAESPDSSFSSKKGYEDAQQSDKWYSHHPTVIAPPQFEAEKKSYFIDSGILGYHIKADDFSGLEGDHWMATYGWANPMDIACSYGPLSIKTEPKSQKHLNNLEILAEVALADARTCQIPYPSMDFKETSPYDHGNMEMVYLSVKPEPNPDTVSYNCKPDPGDTYDLLPMEPRHMEVETPVQNLEREARYESNKLADTVPASNIPVKQNKNFENESANCHGTFSKVSQLKTARDDNKSEIPLKGFPGELSNELVAECEKKFAALFEMYYNNPISKPVADPKKTSTLKEERYVGVKPRTKVIRKQLFKKPVSVLAESLTTIVYKDNEDSPLEVGLLPPECSKRVLKSRGLTTYEFYTACNISTVRRRQSTRIQSGQEPLAQQPFLLIDMIDSGGLDDYLRILRLEDTKTQVQGHQEYMRRFEKQGPQNSHEKFWRRVEERKKAIKARKIESQRRRLQHRKNSLFKLPPNAKCIACRRWDTQPGLGTIVHDFICKGCMIKGARNQ